MQIDGIEVIEVELKYCERCGGLWLRRKGSMRVYCLTCEPVMAEFPQPRLKPLRQYATPVPGDIDAWDGDFVIFCAEGHA